MKKASISEAKNQLSALIDAAKQGESILLTDRDKPVARLVPVVSDELTDRDTRIARLERAGLLRRGRKPLPKEFLNRKMPEPAGGVDIIAEFLAQREEGW